MAIGKLHVLGMGKIFRIMRSVQKHGYTLMALLDSVKDNSPDAFIKDDTGQLAYNELYEQSVDLAYHLNKKYSIKSKSKVALVSSNSLFFVKSLFAVSGLGADIYLLNPGQKKDYFDGFLAVQKIDLIIGEATVSNNPGFYEIPFFCDEIIKMPAGKGLPDILKRKKSNIIILSSGSKGKPKAEKRKVGVISYLNPLIDIMERLRLKQNKSVLISVPVFHGYGLAALFMAVFMGQKIRLAKKFDAKKTLQILKEEKPDCWIAVPLMMQKVYGLEGAASSPLKSIISGGDVLPAGIVANIHKNTQAKVYNMYGTSETGVCTIAAHQDLLKHPDTIGRAITGVSTRIENAGGVVVNTGEVGALLVKCGWSSDSSGDEYVPTGDLVSRNKDGYYFYKGRQDDLMVIGGENVYPIELENVIYKNPDIKWVKVKSIADENQVTKIHADVVVRPQTSFSETAFTSWLAGEVPGYMIPKSFTVLDEEPIIKLMQ